MISSAPPIKYPCQHCSKRTIQPNCHCVCEKYLDVVAKNEEYKAQERQRQIYKAYKQELMNKLFKK